MFGHHKNNKKFKELGIFADIHVYFEDRYQNVWASYDDFDERATHFFGFLTHTLTGGEKSKYASFSRDTRNNTYRNLYDALLVNLALRYGTDVHSRIVQNYILKISIIARDANLSANKKGFYQRFLLGIFLPILNKDEKINNAMFKDIVAEFPESMLVAEQEKSPHTNAPDLLDSNLFIQMMESKRFDAVDRLKDTVSFFPEKNREKYVLVVRLMLQILSSSEISITSANDRASLVTAFQALLFYTHEKDAKFFDDKLKELGVEFYQAVLFSASFLEQIDRIKSPETVDYIFKFWVKIFCREKENVDATKSVALFKTNCFNCVLIGEGGYVYKSRINIKKLPAVSCSIYLGVFFEAYSQEDLKISELRNYLKFLTKSSKSETSLVEKIESEVLMHLINFVLNFSEKNNRSVIVADYENCTSLYLYEKIKCLQHFTTVRLLMDPQDGDIKKLNLVLNKRAEKLKQIKRLADKPESAFPHKLIDKHVTLSGSAEVVLFDMKQAPEEAGHGLRSTVSANLDNRAHRPCVKN